MPVLRRPHDRHRNLRARLPAKVPTNARSNIDQDRHVMRPSPPIDNSYDACQTWIVDADHDEAIKRENTLIMADNIPGSGLLIEPQ
jgi:hypothetical protein